MPPPNPSPSPQGGRRRVENSEEVAAALAARYPAAKVRLVDFAARPDLAMPEQVRWRWGLWAVGWEAITGAFGGVVGCGSMCMACGRHRPSPSLYPLPKQTITP